MIKTKYLHRKQRKVNSHRDWDNKKYKRVPKHKYETTLPKKESIKKVYRYNYLDFTPLSEFLEAKIGENWDAVYSEILTKIKPKFRYQLEQSFEWLLYDVCYTEDFKPYGNWNRLLINCLFIDEKNILQQYNTEQELITDSKKKLRREKIRRILEIQEGQED